MQATIAFFFLVFSICASEPIIKDDGERNLHRRLKFEYRKVEKKLCADNEPNHCRACLHYKDSKKEHARNAAFIENLKLIDDQVSRQKENRNNSTNLTKIVFLGDSITEQMNGRLSGQFRDKWKDMFKSVFDKIFEGRALALGTSMRKKLRSIKIITYLLSIRHRRRYICMASLEDKTW